MANQALAVVEPSDTSIIEEVVAKGDLKLLSAEDRAHYYVDFCRSVGLNPHTQPLQYIILNGKLTLYATKGATDQLRKLHGVSVVRLDKEIVDDLYVVTVAVKDRDGRTDEDMGVVVIGGLKGDAKINAMLKCISKAKRRATLSITGLPLLDETEIETVATARPVRVDVETGEILEVEPTPLHVTADEGGNGYPVTEPTAKERQDDHRTTQNARYHAVCTDVGLSKDATKCYAHIRSGRDSRAKLTGQELSDLADLADAELARLSDGSLHPLVEFANRICAAPDKRALVGIATEMKEAGVGTDWLREMWKRQNAAVPATAPLVDAPESDGEVGEDKYTR